MSARFARWLVPAIVAAVAAAVILGRGADGYTIRVEFENAAGLRRNSRVKIDGVPVGKVSSLAVTGRDTAVATLSVDERAGRVGAGARADVRPASLLGEKFVDLEPGELGRPAASGALIGLRRTGAPVELDDLLNVLDPDTRAALGAFINESGIALAGRGADFNATLAELPTALDRAERMIGDFAADNRALGRLVEESDRFLGAVAPQRAALGRLVASADGALSTAASRHTQLRATVERAPGVLAQLRRSLRRLESTATTLGPAADGLRRAAPRLTAMLGELPPFARAAIPTLAQARRSAPTLSELGRRATPVVERLRPAADDLARYATAFDPASGTLDAFIDDALGLVEGWVRAIQVRDAAAHLFRNNNNGMTTQTIEALVDRYLRPTPRRARPRRPAARRVARRYAPAKPRPERHLDRLPGADRLPSIDRLPALPAAPDAQAAPQRVQELLDYLLDP